MDVNVWAVVVTYNRPALLRECVEALRGQQSKCHILIVDNASTDETRDYCTVLCENDTGVTYKRMDRNIGGAGGFAHGMSYAVEHGATHVWIMDDDTISGPDTLSELMRAAKEIDEPFGFLSSEVLWTDGSPCRMNLQQERKAANSREETLISRCGLVPVNAATFVSLLFCADSVKRYGLPIEEYFIWGDDKEYTLRLSSHLPCYKVKSSRVVHKMKNNEGSNITYDDVERIGRYFYAYRNDYCTARRSGVAAIVVYHMAFILNMMRILLHASYKKQRIETMLRGRKAGLHFNPEIRYPNI